MINDNLYMQNLSKNLRDYIDYNNLTISYLAKQIAISRQTLSRIEMGKENFRYKTVKKISQNINIDFISLFDDSFNPSNTTPFVEYDYLEIFFLNLEKYHRKKHNWAIYLQTETGTPYERILKLKKGTIKDVTIDTLWKFAQTVSTKNVANLFSIEF